MKTTTLAIFLPCALAVFACTTLKPVAATPSEVQRQLLSDQLLEPGDRVRLVTADEAVHEFRVTQSDLEDGIVIGRDKPTSRKACGFS